MPGSFKVAICNELFGAWPIEKVFRTAASLGYDAIEIAPFTICEMVGTLSQEARRSIRDLAVDSGIRIAATHWLLRRKKDLHLFNEEGDYNRETLDYLMDVVQFTSDIGATIAVFGSPRQRSLPSLKLRETAWRNAIQAFGAIGDYATEHAVTFCLEPLSRDQTNFINTVDEAVRLIEEIGSANVRLILDVRAMCDEGRDLGKIIRAGAKHLRHFHANDCNGYIPGTGSANYEQTIKTLKDIGYDGYLSVEVFDYRPDPFTVAQKSIVNLRALAAASPSNGNVPPVFRI